MIAGFSVNKSIDVFIAYPMAGVDREPNKRVASEIAQGLADALRDFELSVFLAEAKAGKDLPNFTLNRTRLEESRVLVLVTAESEISRSSIWVEAGMALVLDMPVICVAPFVEALPILIRRALVPVNQGGQFGVFGLWIDEDPQIDAALEFLVPQIIDRLRPRIEDLRNV